ncbi:hypothetical protein LZ30DRAFT_7856 [Colletotrichum cereale]|nr:hypothetical protein LZ30DRAFT_7856 [Colletotrichum cereale]
MNLDLHVQKPLPQAPIQSNPPPFSLLSTNLPPFPMWPCSVSKLHLLLSPSQRFVCRWYLLRSTTTSLPHIQHAPKPPSPIRGEDRSRDPFLHCFPRPTLRNCLISSVLTARPIPSVASPPVDLSFKRPVSRPPFSARHLVRGTRSRTISASHPATVTLLPQPCSPFSHHHAPSNTNILILFGRAHFRSFPA